jgi:type I restriction enzyme M protein
MTTSQSGEGLIRKKLVESDMVDCILQLPGQLFYSTSIPVCVWFISRRNETGSQADYDRKGKTLFIDARRLGVMVDRVHKELTDDDINSIVESYHLWRGISKNATSKGYRDIPGFCRSASIAEIRAHKFALVPGRYVGFSDDERPDLSHLDLKTELAALSARLDQISTSAAHAANILTSLTNG